MEIQEVAVIGAGAMGSLKLSDFVGLDVLYHSSKSTAAEITEEYILKRFQPSKLLEKMVKEGRIGAKTKKGFYEY